MIALGLDCIVYICKKNFETQKIISEVHFNTGRLLFEFNGLQYRFAAGQVFVAFANPVSGCKASTTPETPAPNHTPFSSRCRGRYTVERKQLGRQDGVFDNISEVNVWIWTWEGGSAWCLSGPCLRG